MWEWNGTPFQPDTNTTQDALTTLHVMTMLGTDIALINRGKPGKSR
jgi:hypothetical protein